MLPATMSFLKSFPPPAQADGLRQQQPDTEAVLNGKGLGTGTLYIAERWNFSQFVLFTRPSPGVRESALLLIRGHVQGFELPNPEEDFSVLFFPKELGFFKNWVLLITYFGLGGLFFYSIFEKIMNNLNLMISRLSWLDGSGLGFSLEYPSISLHAVSRDLNAYPREHLYVMVNAKFGEESKESLADEEEEDSDDDVEPITEFRFVPSDKSALEAMFTAMCECQALHPDPEDEDSDDYDGEEYDVEAHEQGQGDIPTFYTYEEGLSHLTAEGQATLERLEGMLSQSVSSQYNMAGVRTEDSVRDYEDGMEVDSTPTVAGQFEDADVDH